METFIAAVRAQQCLWNPLHPLNHVTHAKEDAWHCVVEQVNDDSIPNVQVAKTEWKKLRDNHRDALKRAKLGINKLLPAQITTWKYAKAMQFLEPHMKYRITENIEMEPPLTTKLKNSEYDVSTTEPADRSNVSNKRRCLKAPERPKETKSNNTDSDALASFFNCILQSTREMPQYMQTQVKKKIFAVIIEAEEYLAQEQGHKNEENNFVIETKVKEEVFTDDSCDKSYT